MSSTILPLGLVGGMSAESTLVYYRRLIELSRERLGGVRCPRIVIVNVEFARYVEWQHAGRWDRVAEGIGSEVTALAAAGCAFAGIAANTMHKVLPDLAPPIPLLSILDAVADGARARGFRRLGVTGTKFTMEDGFYARGLEERGLEVVTPPADARAEIHRTIYDELTQGRVEAASVARFADVAKGLLEAGADAVLLGCTELPLLAEHPSWPPGLPLLDSTEAHVQALFRASTGLDLDRSPGAAALRERLAATDPQPEGR
jgi:aspartate racemase